MRGMCLIDMLAAAATVDVVVYNEAFFANLV